MQPRTSILDLFPVELLTMIKEQIPQSDLRTHVFYYMSFPSITSSLYGNLEEEEKFWETVCVQAGLGLLPGETIDPQSVSWRKVAFECISYEGLCDHPACGQELLDANADYMYYQIDDDLHDISRNAFFQVIPDGPDLHSAGTVINEVLGFMQFHDRKPLGDEVRPPTKDIFMYYSDREEQDPPRQLLRYHPVAARSFACFPPARRLLIDGPVKDNFIPVENAYGVTVWDVYSALQSRLEDEMSVKHLQKLLDENKFTDVFPTGCSVPKLLRSLTTFRQFLSFYRIKGMEFIDWQEDGLYIFPTFEPVRSADPTSEKGVY
ncbi:hypothetical protein EIP91_002450 [Steccherinum ochraceum]|uniref:Uncharacterized protein n=1 Tax=Steccherinum ochraceum TaxID=92696 RepID=A0A4R0RFU4_9APHY|nr:hypothetical protein EIP91_002450 [Steccherinum ochraceum]